MKLFTSASRLVFLLIAVTTCAGFILGRIDIQNFMLIATGVFSYYYTRDKGTDTPTNV